MSDAPYDQYSKGEVEKAVNDRKRLMLAAFTFNGIQPDSASFKTHLETIQAQDEEGGIQDANAATAARELLEEFKSIKSITAPRQKDVSIPAFITAHMSN
jgi:hypothetical protein